MYKIVLRDGGSLSGKAYENMERKDIKHGID